LSLHSLSFSSLCRASRTSSLRVSRLIWIYKNSYLFG
jgi:hypothetical protein